MMRTMRKTHFIALAAITLDGKLARSTRQISFGWTSKEDYKFFKGYVDACDAIIVGRNTHRMSKSIIEKRNRNCIIFTRAVSGIEEKSPKLVYMNPTKKRVINYCRKRGFKKVAVLGGTGVFDYFLKQSLLDEMYLTIEPVVFGAGVPLLSQVTKARVKVRTLKKLNARGTVLYRIRF